MSKVVKLGVVRDQRRRQEARIVRDQMKSKVREIGACAGADLAGFAIVAFDRQGDSYGTWALHHTPFGGALLPELAKQSLLRGMAAQETVVPNLDPDPDDA